MNPLQGKSSWVRRETVEAAKRICHNWEPEEKKQSTGHQGTVDHGQTTGQENMQVEHMSES